MFPWGEWFADILWIEGRRIIKHDGTEIALTDEGAILLAMLRLASSSPARFRMLMERLRPLPRPGYRLLRRRARLEEQLLWEAISTADIGALGEHCQGCTFRLERINDAGDGDIGWRLTGHLRVIT